LGSIELIRSGAMGSADKPVMDLVTIAERNSTRLLDIVNDILDFERLSSGIMELHFERLDLVDLTQDAIAEMTPFAKIHDVELVMGTESAGLLISGDRQRLSQVLTNLISNASKFSPKGSTVVVNIIEKNGMARLEVVDSGPGIPADMREAIFDRFTQIDCGDTRSISGTGLGLSICKSIIEHHNGRLSVEANAPKGSIFYFELDAQPKTD